MIQMPATYEYLFRLISAEFSGQTPPEKPEDVSWDSLYAEAKRQNLISLVYDCIKRLQVQPDEQNLRKWELRYNKLISKSINQSVEIERVLETFEQNGIDALPLKGYLLRDLYPHRELRDMSDFDLLVKDDRSEKMKQLMASLGYEFSADVDHHASFHKPPYVVIELHAKLLPDRFGNKEYCRGVWERSKRCEGKRHLYAMTVEDFVIFNMLHFEKHYHNTGCGIRFLVDVHAMRKAYESQLDQAYFQKTLELLGMREFNETAFCLERAVFAGGESTPEAEEMLNRMIRLGVFGSNAGREENIIERLTPKNGNEKIGKLRYYLRIVFPPVSEMECSYPVVRKAKFLLPVFWVCRGVKTIFRNPKHISEHYQRIMSYGKDEENQR